MIWSRGRIESYANLSEHASPSNERLRFVEVAGGFDISDAGGLAVLSREMARQAAMIGYINAFLVFAIVAAVAAPMVLLFRNPK